MTTLSCSRCGQPAPKPRSGEKPLCKPCHKIVVGWCRRGTWPGGPPPREAPPSPLDDAFEDMHPDDAEQPGGRVAWIRELEQR